MPDAKEVYNMQQKFVIFSDIKFKQMICYLLIPLMAKPFVWLCGHYMLLGAQFHI